MSKCSQMLEITLVSAIITDLLWIMANSTEIKPLEKKTGLSYRSFDQTCSFSCRRAERWWRFSGGPLLQRTNKVLHPWPAIWKWTLHMMYSHIWSWCPSRKHQRNDSTSRPSVDIILRWAAQIIHDPAAGWEGRAASGRLPAVPPRPGSRPYSRATLLTPTPVLYALHTLKHSQELIPLFSRVRHPHA